MELEKSKLITKACSENHSRAAFFQSYSSKNKPLKGNTKQTGNDHMNILSNGSKVTNRNEKFCKKRVNIKTLKNRFFISVQCSSRRLKNYNFKRLYKRGDLSAEIIFSWESLVDFIRGKKTPIGGSSNVIADRPSIPRLS